MRLVCHLADHTMETSPGTADIGTAVAQFYEALVADEKGLMSESLYKSAAVNVREGRPFV